MWSADGSFRSFRDAQFLKEVVRVRLLGGRACYWFRGRLFTCGRFSFVTDALELSKKLFIRKLL